MKRPHLLLICTLLASVFAEPPFVGDGGWTLSFDHRKADVIGMQWNVVPAQNLTTEFWLRIVDPWVEEQTLFSYSAFDATQSPAYEDANEFQIRVKRTRIGFYRASDAVTCEVKDHPECFVYTTTWIHIAITWSSVTGEVQIFKNGALIFTRTSTDDGFLTPIVPRGCVHFVQEADAFCGDFDEMQMLHGFVDEFRMWNYVRSPAQIQEYYALSIPPSMIQVGDLNIYWKFDDYNDDSADDSSGTGNVGLLGELPDLRNQMTWATNRKPGPPTSPVYIKSHAPVIGSQIVVALVAAQGQQITIDLKALDRDTPILQTSITDMPSFGTLNQIGSNTLVSLNDTVVDSANNQSKRIYYTPNSMFAEDTFQYSVNDGSNTVTATVYIRYSNVIQPTTMSLLLSEDQWGVMSLGEVNLDGQAVSTIITQLPTRGQLFQAKFLNDTPETYFTAITVEAQLTPILSVNTTATNEVGIVLFRPAANAYNSSVYSTIGFAWEQKQLATSATVVSASGVTNVHVASVNDPPVGIPTTLQYSYATSEILVPLASTDVDSNFSPHPFYRISAFPTFGNLYQVTENSGARGDILVDLQNPATVVSWVKKVLNFSSQYSRCDCSYPPPALEQCIQDSGCTNFGFNAVQAVGPADVFPKYGESVLAWEPLLNRGFEFIELEFHNQIFLEGVEIYETNKPGGVTSVKVANIYNGTATNWGEVWSGVQELNLADTARIFIPPVCPYADKVKYVRIELNTENMQGWNSIDASKLLGTLDLPRGRVLNSQGMLMYAPRQGIHAASISTVFDRFSFTATDCQSESTPTTISITYADLPPQEYSATFWKQYQVPSQVGTTTPVVVDIPGILIDVSQALGVTVNASSVTIELKHTDGGTEFYQTSDGSTLGQAISVPGVITGNLFTFIIKPTEEGDSSFHVWVTTTGYVYRLKYEANAAPAPPISDDNTGVLIAAIVGPVGGLLLIGLAATNFMLFRKWTKRKARILVAPDFKAIEFGESYKKASNISKSKLLLLLSLQDLLLNLQFTSLLVDLTKKDDEIMKSIFYIFKANNKAVDLIKFYAQREIAKTTTIETLFREDSVCTKFFRRYTRVVGLEYLWSVLAIILNELQDNLNEKASKTGSSIIEEKSSIEMEVPSDNSSSTGNFEVDPSKFSERDDEKINKLNLLLLAQRVFHAITHSANRFPSELKTTLSAITSVLKERFPDQELNSLLGGFIFLRFFCPAIIAPHSYGLFEKPPSSSCQRVMILLSKILQNLSNGLLFEGKEEFMSKLNDFITMNIDEVKTFLREISQEQSATLEIKLESDDDEQGDDSIPTSVHYKALRTVHKLITDERDAIFSAIELKHFDDEDTMADVKQHLNLIYSITKT